MGPQKEGFCLIHQRFQEAVPISIIYLDKFVLILDTKTDVMETQRSKRTQDGIEKMTCLRNIL